LSVRKQKNRFACCESPNVNNSFDQLVFVQQRSIGLPTTKVTMSTDPASSRLLSADKLSDGTVRKYPSTLFSVCSWIIAAEFVERLAFYGFRGSLVYHTFTFHISMIAQTLLTCYMNNRFCT
jgi:hypothetical protein